MEQPITTIILKGRYQVENQPTGRAGVYGNILKARDLNKIYDEVALKQVKSAITQQGVSPSTLREIALLGAMKQCQYIIKLIQYFSENQKFYFVFPYVKMDLREFMHIKHEDRVPLNLVKKIMFQLLSAVSYAHSKNVMHRDIKPENILVVNPDNPQKLQIKLADWGSSRYQNRIANQQFTVEVIPLAYRPPQLLFESRYYNQSVDMWSVGCLFAQLLFGQRIFKSVTQNSLLYEIIETIGVNDENDMIWLSQHYQVHGQEVPIQTFEQFRAEPGKVRGFDELNKNNQAYDLLKKLLKIHPSKRIQARNTLNHPYFQNM